MALCSTKISTNTLLNLIFFLVFVVFALSFFGLFEITLPAKWSNATSQNEGKKGVVGIFFMALTLALVSFSCTGPLLGSLLAGSISTSGSPWTLTAALAGFGLALGLPFALFAIFPRLLASLPKSGGWMTSVKVILGFLELALALKFLSNADMVNHWGVLKYEVFLALWVVIFLCTAFYCLGWIKFPHEYTVQKSKIKTGFGMLCIVFVGYLGTGFTTSSATNSYNSPSLLSGILPSSGYSLFKPSQCPYGIDCFNDFIEGVAHAQKVNKPIMLDFTGYACVNCRKMEEHVWPKGIY